MCQQHLSGGLLGKVKNHMKQTWCPSSLYKREVYVCNDVCIRMLVTALLGTEKKTLNNPTAG